MNNTLQTMKTQKIEIRVDPETKLKIKEAAEKLGLSLSSYVLSKTLKALNDD